MSVNRTLKTVSQFSNDNPAFTVPSIRWLIFQEKHNGLASSGAIVRIGRKVLIDEDLSPASSDLGCCCHDHSGGVQTGGFVSEHAVIVRVLCDGLLSLSKSSPSPR